MNLREDFNTALAAGGAIGGFVSLVVFIWAAITYIQPALSVNANLGNLYANLLTLGIAFCGGLEVSLGAGVLLGMLKATLLFAMIYLPIACIKKTCDPNLLARNSSQQLKQLSQNNDPAELQEIVIVKRPALSDNKNTPQQDTTLDTINEAVEKKEDKRPHSLTLFSNINQSENKTEEITIIPPNLA